MLIRHKRQYIFILLAIRRSYLQILSASVLNVKITMKPFLISSRNDWCITNNFRDYAVFTGGPTGRYLAAVAPTINDNIRSYSCCC